MQKNKLSVGTISLLIISVVFSSFIMLSTPQHAFAKTTTKAALGERTENEGSEINDNEKNENEHKTVTKKISKKKHKKVTARNVITTTKTTITPTPKTTPVTTTSSYSLSDIAAHNSSTSCWTAIGGKAYDLTSWISQHPGGRQAILSLCGADGTTAFNNQHGGQARPEQELKSFLIGTIK